MRLGQDVLGDLSASLAREWLLSNGVGGSSSGTVAGASALRAHAWLASGTDGMPRALLLGTAERVRTAAGAFDLAGPASPARPGGPLTPESFALDPFPVWTWNVGGARIERSLFLVTGHDAVAIRYRHVEGPGVTLTVSPLVVSRPLGELQAQDPGFRGASQAVPGRIRIELPEQRSLTLFHNGAFLPARVWRPVEHALEREPVREDVCVPGYVESTLADGSSLMLVASTREDLFRALAAEDRLGSPPPRTLADCCARLEHHEREERSRWLEAALIGADLTAHQARVAHTPAESMPAERTTLIDRADGWTAALAEVLMAGLRRRGGRLTLVSSLPGAGESGVDALRALPGLLALRAFEPVREVLRGYCEYLDEGLAPERFEADGTPRYGDPRPALWLVHAAELYARRSGDVEFSRAVLLPACESVVQFYRARTNHGVGVQPDGLLAHGEHSVRDLESNALWSHALVAAAQLARTLDRRESAAFHLAWARDHQQRFLEAFWDAERGELFARIEGERGVRGFGPESLLAASLSPPLLPAESLQALVGSVMRKLWTPCGLREAEGASRVRPGGLGPFATAYLRAHGREGAALATVGGWFEGLQSLGPHLEVGPPEAFDLADPEAPVRIGDAVSITTAAELVRAWIEDVDHSREPALSGEDGDSV